MSTEESVEQKDVAETSADVVAPVSDENQPVAGEAGTPDEAPAE